MNGKKKRKPYEEVIPLYITLPTSFNDKCSKDTNLSIFTGKKIKVMKDWVD